jgi:uncharacterized protein with HEPN domain
MLRDYRLYLDDILEAIEQIRSYITGYSWIAFERDRRTQDAVIRNLEIKGEAAGKLPEDLYTTSQNVEWRKFIAFRNVLIHEYFGVSLAIVWDVVQNKLDPLKTACCELLEMASRES